MTTGHWVAIYFPFKKFLKNMWDSLTTYYYFVLTTPISFPNQYELKFPERTVHGIAQSNKVFVTFSPFG